MDERTLFSPDPGTLQSKPVADHPVQMRVLITVEAAPNPSGTYGETVCVAGIRLDPEHSGWVRLYPINLRHLGPDHKFRKYDVVTLEARPARQDSRVESWRPNIDSIRVASHLNDWQKRRPYIVDQLSPPMCDILRDVKERPPARSLGAIRPRKVTGLDIEPHPGWSTEEKAKIDQYVNQLDLLSEPRKALEAPRFRGWYRYECRSLNCRGHRQGILDWEFVALQRNLSSLNDEDAISEIRERFFEQICAPDRDTIFYVGNQAKRYHVFSILGAFYPRRR